MPSIIKDMIENDYDDGDDNEYEFDPSRDHLFYLCVTFALHT